MTAELPKVVVITGASAGVGRAVARAWGRRGVGIGLVARSADRLEAARQEVEALGGRAVVVLADVAEPARVEAAASRIEQELGPIDVWINNAMAGVFSPVEHMTAAEYRRVTDVTYLGYVWGTLAALRRMRRRGRGVIVQVSSALAYRAMPLQSASCAAKHAVKGFTESLRTELLHDRSDVRVVMVELPAVNTPQYEWARSKLPRRARPMSPTYEPEVIAEGIVHAAMHPRRELVIGWTTLKAMVVEKIAPSLADRYFAKRGVDAQMTGTPEDPKRADNLYAPAGGDHGAHGRFEARRSSAQLWVATHRRLVAVCFFAAATSVLLVARLRRARRARDAEGHVASIVRCARARSKTWLR